MDNMKWKIQIHKTKDERSYTLRLYVNLPRLGYITFESEIFSKSEADVRAMNFSSLSGCLRDEFPTYECESVFPIEIRRDKEY